MRPCHIEGVSLHSHKFRSTPINAVTFAYLHHQMRRISYNKERLVLKEYNCSTDCEAVWAISSSSF